LRRADIRRVWPLCSTPGRASTALWVIGGKILLEMNHRDTEKTIRNIIGSGIAIEDTKNESSLAVSAYLFSASLCPWSSIGWTGPLALSGFHHRRRFEEKKANDFRHRAVGGMNLVAIRDCGKWHAHRTLLTIRRNGILTQHEGRHAHSERDQRRRRATGVAPVAVRIGTTILRRRKTVTGLACHSNRFRSHTA
jgi:hypothetical protein